MKKILFIFCFLVVSLVYLTQIDKYNSSNMSYNQEVMPIPQDSAIIHGGWRCKYLESPLYIKNQVGQNDKDY